MRLRSYPSLIAVVIAGAVLAEVLMRPATGSDRLRLLMVLAAPAVVTVASVPLIEGWVSRRASVASAALGVALCSLAIGTVTTSAASNAMFLSTHDFRLFLVVLLVSSGIALVVGGQLTRPLAGAISRLGTVAERVADGDLTARTMLDRRDEIGRTARAVDRMVEKLAETDRQRAQLEVARNDLFTAVGHDLRTPLAAMRAAVESLQDGIAQDPQRYYDILALQLGSVEGLLDKLVDYARLETAGGRWRHEPVSMSEVAHEAVEALTPVAVRDSVSLDLTSVDPGTVIGDHSELSRVVRNLIENAVRHSPPGGAVTVTVTSDPQRVQLVVADSGPGFAAEFRDSAFEPFSRADPARNTRTGHAGLGLAIARNIVTNHGGTISIGDGPGGSVIVELPRKDRLP